FVKLAQTYSGYKCTIQQLHDELKNLTIIQKAYYITKGTYCAGLQKRINFLYDQLNFPKNEVPTHKKPIVKDLSFEIFPQYAEYTILSDIYHAHAPFLSNAIDKRINTFNAMTKDDYVLQYANKS